MSSLQRKDDEIEIAGALCRWLRVTESLYGLNFHQRNFLRGWELGDMSWRDGRWLVFSHVSFLCDWRAIEYAGCSSVWSGRQLAWYPIVDPGSASLANVSSGAGVRRYM